MVGPDYQTPKAPATKQYTRKPLPSKTASTPLAGKAGSAQTFRPGEDIPALWWNLYHSRAINQLVMTGLKANPNLEAAKASLRVAKENLRATWGNLLLPSANLQLGYERTRFSEEQFGTPITNLFSLYSAQTFVAYNLDVFGGARRQVEAARANVDFEGYELMAAQLTLTSTIVTTAITAAAQKAQIKATQELIAFTQKQLNLMNQQFSLGAISKETVLSQETLLAQTKASLPPVQKNYAQSQHALAALIGCLPSEARLPEINLNELTLPKELPLSLPSKLVQQRPDIKAAEALLHQASANVGVATAKLLPQFPISANYGYSSDQFNDLFTAFRNTWAYSINPTQILFQGGALLASRRAAIATLDEAFQKYRQTVLLAFQNVADSLRAIEADAKELHERKNAEVAALNTLTLTQKQYKLGAISYLSLLNAEQQYQQTLLTRIQAEARRYTDTALLFQALGGGWWNCKERCAA